MKKDIIERLLEIQEKEVKRREKAVDCLEDLTAILAPILLDVIGNTVLLLGIPLTQM